MLADLRERRFRKVLLSNGIPLEEHTIDLMKKAGVIPTISLDGPNPDVHDAFRGVAGAFRKTLKSLELLRERNVEYGINCCLHRRNLSKHERIVEIAVEHGASRIAFLDLKPVGRMKENTEWIPSYEEYEKTALDLVRTKLKHGREIDVALDTYLHCYPLSESVKEAKKGFISCQGGRTRLSITSDGSVYPCNLAISDSHFNMGNIRNGALFDIWHSSHWGSFRGEVKLTNLSRCRNCKNLNKCDDFYCRILPYMTSGDLFGPHPKCDLSSLQAP